MYSHDYVSQSPPLVTRIIFGGIEPFPRFLPFVSSIRATDSVFRGGDDLELMLAFLLLQRSVSLQNGRTCCRAQRRVGELSSPTLIFL